MSRKSASRQLKDAEARNMKKMRSYLEVMCAAYVKATNVDPNNVALQVDTVTNPDKTLSHKYYYVPYERKEKTNLADVHPDIEHLFHLTYGLLQAKKQGDAKSIEDGYEMLEQFMKKYAEQLEETPAV
jgi:hypothetical protein